MSSILKDLRKTINAGEDNDYYDDEIMMYANGFFSILTQLGVGPSDGFGITDETAQWTDWLDERDKRFGMAKSYVCTKVRLMVDPPSSPSAVESLERMAKEYEWRIREGEKTNTDNKGEEDV